MGPRSQLAHTRYFVWLLTVLEKPTFSNVNMSETSQKDSTESHAWSLPLTDRRFASASDGGFFSAPICGRSVGLLVSTAVCGRRMMSSQKEQTIVCALRSPTDGKLSMERKTTKRPLCVQRVAAKESARGWNIFWENRDGSSEGTTIRSKRRTKDKSIYIRYFVDRSRKIHRKPAGSISEVKERTNDTRSSASDYERYSSSKIFSVTGRPTYFNDAKYPVF